MTRSLFRPEAIESHRQRLYGEVVVAVPLSFAVLTGFLLLVLLSGAAFLVTGHYARKETAVGYLQPDLGILKMVAPRAGIVATLFVAEGDLVKAGAPLLTIISESGTAGGVPIDETVRQSVMAQLGEIESRLQIEARRIKGEKERLSAERTGVLAESAETDAQLEVQNDLVAVAEENLKAIEDLTARGVVSETEYKARKERVLGYRQQLASLRQQKAALTARHGQLVLAETRLPMEMEQRLSELQSARADLERQLAELAGRRELTMTAPVNGRVTALQAVRGAQITDRPLLAILPEGGRLEAHLYVPTRAIGFIRPGQSVRIAYDAFDYRRFGRHQGVIRDVSRTILAPQEAPGPVLPQEPVYRVTVALEEESVSAFGEDVPLQAGMTLSADIVLEKRSFFEWLFEPLYSLRGRG